MPSKLDKIARLTEGLAAAMPDPGQKPPPPKKRRQVGVPVTLRTPEDLMRRYAAEAARRTAETGRTVTLQAVMLEVLAKGLPHHG